MGAADANLVIILLDAACADHFTSFGYGWNTTPRLGKLFDESVLLTEADAAVARQSPRSPPSSPASFPTRTARSR